MRHASPHRPGLAPSRLFPLAALDPGFACPGILVLLPPQLRLAFARFLLLILADFLLVRQKFQTLVLARPRQKTPTEDRQKTEEMLPNLDPAKEALSEHLGQGWW